MASNAYFNIHTDLFPGGEILGIGDDAAVLRVAVRRGEHDRHAGDPPSELNIDCVDEPHLESSFVLAHHPQQSRYGYVLAGHLHPGAPLVGRGRMRERLPCFWLGHRCGVLPAFGDFTGLLDAPRSEATPDPAPTPETPAGEAPAEEEPLFVPPC